MLKGRRRWLALGAVMAALAVGAGAALAATRAADNGFLAGVAERLGISEEKLQNAIRDESLAQIDQAVKDGKLTQEQADRLKERVRSGQALGPLGGFGRGFGFGPDLGLDFGPKLGHLFRGIDDQIDAAADYLGVTAEQLRTELEDGDSLADVAREKGKSVDGLKAAMRNALKADLDKAVDDGVVTQEQADSLYEKLAPGIDRLVESDFRFPKPFPPGFGFGFGLGLGNADLEKAAADYLGLTEAQLEERLEDGDSLSEIAKDEGKSVDGLKAALKKAVRDDLDAAVDKGAITKAQADDLYGHLSEHVDRLVENGGRFGFRMKFRGPGGGFDFRFGPPERSDDDTEPSVYEPALRVQVF
jgi:ribosomal protein S20